MAKRLFRKFKPSATRSQEELSACGSCKLHHLDSDTSVEESFEARRSRKQTLKEAVSRQVRRFAQVVATRTTSGHTGNCSLNRQFALDDEDAEDLLKGVDDDCRNFVEKVSSLDSVKNYEQDMTTHLMMIDPKQPSEAREAVCHKIAFHFGTGLLIEAWNVLNENLCKREKEVMFKEEQSREIRRQSIEMQAQMMKELSLLRDQNRGLGSHIIDACSVVICDPMTHLDEETRSLVTVVAEEQVKRMFAEMDKDVDSFLNVMIQERKAPLLEQLSKAEDRLNKLERDCLELTEAKSGLESEATSLRSQSTWLNASMETMTSDLKEARSMVQCLQRVEEELRIEVDSSKSETERYKFEIGQIRQEATDSRAAMQELLKDAVPHRETEASSVSQQSQDPHRPFAAVDQSSRTVPRQHISPTAGQTPSEGDAAQVAALQKARVDAERYASLNEIEQERPILPGASAAVLLAHAEGLQASIEADPSKTVDSAAVLGVLCAKIDDEFHEVMLSVPDSDAVTTLEGRLRHSWSVGSVMGRLCAAALQDIAVLHNLTQGRGQPQMKLNMVSKRLELSMEVLQSHIGAWLAAASDGVHHLEDLRRLAANPQGACENEDAGSRFRASLPHGGDNGSVRVGSLDTVITTASTASLPSASKDVITSQRSLPHSSPSQPAGRGAVERRDSTGSQLSPREKDVITSQRSLPHSSPSPSPPLGKGAIERRDSTGSQFSPGAKDGITHRRSLSSITGENIVERRDSTGSRMSKAKSIKQLHKSVTKSPRVQADTADFAIDTPLAITSVTSIGASCSPAPIPSPKAKSALKKPPPSAGPQPPNSKAPVMLAAEQPAVLIKPNLARNLTDGCAGVGKNVVNMSAVCASGAVDSGGGGLVATTDKEAELSSIVPAPAVELPISKAGTIRRRSNNEGKNR